MSAIAAALEGLAHQFGLPGVFVTSLVGSAVPFVPLPYLAVVVLLSGTQNPLLLGLIAGTGGALGKTTSYLLGRFGYFAVGGKTKESMDVLRGALGKYGMLGVFLFAVTPLPDDVYAIPMGIIRLPFWRFFVAVLAGKIFLSVAFAYLGRAYFSSLILLFGGESFLVTTIALALTVLLSITILRADWVSAVEIAHARGLRALASSLPWILRLRRRSGK